MKIYYDGDCYFCTRYAKLAKLREAVGPVEIISLRERTPDVERVLEADTNVNTGFVVEHDGRLIHGSEAFGYLNGLMEPDGILQRILLWTSGRPTLNAVLYPMLVVCRFVLLIGQGGALIATDTGATFVQTDDTLGARAIRLGLLLLTGLYVLSIAVHWNAPLKPVLYGALSLATGAAWLWIFFEKDVAVRLFERLRNGDAKIYLIYLLIWLVAVGLLEMIVLRRFAGLFAGFPLIAVCWDLYLKNHGRAEVGTWPALVPAALLAFVLIPGLYIAPFYGGIAGWTAQYDKSVPIRFVGLKLVNDSGREIWHNHAFFQPHTQIGRFRRAYRAGKPKQEFLSFVFDNYKRIYPLLEQGYLPHQYALGIFAYPPHNLADDNALGYVGEFAPERIVAVKRVTAWYSWDKKLVREETKNSYVIPR